MNTPRLPRRHFLRAAAVSAAPFLLPGRVWSAPVPPSERLTLGFIGTGKQARGLLGGFLAKPECQVVAVCDVDTNRRNAARKQAEDHYAKQAGGGFKGCDTFSDFRALLQRADIDAVVVATPDHWHAPISIAAANAGKDIYCEKPLCQSIAEARAMVNAVRRNKRVFQTGSMQRSMREFRVACELVRNGVVGRVIKVQVGVGGPGRWCDLPGEETEPGLDWDLWLGPAHPRPYNSILSPRGVHDHFPQWRAYREYGGGLVTDWGAHHFDIAQWGLGMDHSGPVRIDPAREADAQSGVRLFYADGTEVEHISENGVTFQGTNGSIHVNRGKIQVTINGVEKAKFTTRKEATPLARQLDQLEAEFLQNPKVRLDNSTDHKADWIHCIRSRQKPITDVEVGARSVSVCHLVNFAYYHGRQLRWNPAREQFTGGTGHPAWLDVPRRAPWDKLA